MNAWRGDVMQFGHKTVSLLLLLLALVLVFFLVMTGCSSNKPEQKEQEPPEEQLNNEQEVETEIGLIAPLTGEPVEEEALITRRPLAVIIDNDPTFGAQSGLDKAAWVYEIAAEGGITRFLAVYQHQDAPVLGPVRSARDYFLDRALEFEAALAHIGYSPQAKKDIPQLGIISLNEFALPKLYWRTEDKKMPHNLYTDTQGLFAEVEKRGLNKFTPKWEINHFKAEEDIPGVPVSRIRIHYPLGVVEYRYQAASGAFARSFRGQPHREGETGQQIQVNNVIIQQVERPRVLDSEGRLELKMVGKGEAKVFRAGKGVDATWEKKSRDAWTNYYGPDGDIVSFIKGNTWVQVVPEGTRIEIE
jgi:hypothetical protein